MNKATANLPNFVEAQSYDKFIQGLPSFSPCQQYPHMVIQPNTFNSYECVNPYGMNMSYDYTAAKPVLNEPIIVNGHQEVSLNNRAEISNVLQMLNGLAFNGQRSAIVIIPFTITEETGCCPICRNPKVEPFGHYVCRVYYDADQIEPNTIDEAEFKENTTVAFSLEKYNICADCRKYFEFIISTTKRGMNDNSFQAFVTRVKGIAMKFHKFITADYDAMKIGDELLLCELTEYYIVGHAGLFKTQYIPENQKPQSEMKTKFMAKKDSDGCRLIWETSKTITIAK